MDLKRKWKLLTKEILLNMILLKKITVISRHSKIKKLIINIKLIIKGVLTWSAVVVAREISKGCKMTQTWWICLYLGNMSSNTKREVSMTSFRDVILWRRRYSKNLSAFEGIKFLRKKLCLMKLCGIAHNCKHAFWNRIKNKEIMTFFVKIYSKNPYNFCFSKHYCKSMLTFVDYMAKNSFTQKKLNFNRILESW